MITGLKMAAMTPVKVLEIDCFVCCVARIRPINLSGRKCKQESFGDKLKLLLSNDSDYFGIMNSESSSVCRNCYKKIEQTFDFILQLRNSASNYVCSSGSCVRVKRCVESPKTPKSVNPVNNVLPVNRSRKQLKMQSPAKQIPVQASHRATELQDESSTCIAAEEHGYSKPSLDTCKSSCESPLIDDLRVILKEVSSSSTDDSASYLLKELRAQSSSLTSRTASFCSVLYKYRDIYRLEGSADHFLDEIIEEMINRVPLLLKVMLCIATPASENMKPSIIPAIASAYSILMKHKYDNLSAYHRLTTIIAIRGGLDERFCYIDYFLSFWNISLKVTQRQGKAQTRFNQLGLMLSWSTRVTLQEGIHTMTEKLIADNLKQNPLIKVTGDNLDVYVKTSNLSKERRHKDLHLFTSNIIFSRVSTVDMSNITPKVDIAELNCEKVIMHDQSPEKSKLLSSYAVLLARILCKMPAFKQYEKLVPKHIPHEFSEKMSRKSVVHPLPIMFRNESKHEDCMAIMDDYEHQLTSLYNHAHGSADCLRKYGVLL